MSEQNSQSSNTDNQQSQSSEEYQYDNEESSWQYKKIPPENLETVCKQLGKFVKFLRSLQQLAYYTYDCPSILQTRLETDANELESLYLEIKNAIVTIDKLKKQRKLMKKEKSSVKKVLKKLHDEEVSEMESIISAYDKVMFARWEKIKHTNKPEVLEILLNDVKGKQQAMENLNLLISQRISQLQAPVPFMFNTENASASITNPTQNKDSKSSDVNIIPKRNHHISNSTAARLESRRRKRRTQEHHEKENNTTTHSEVQQERRNNDLPLLPFTIGSNPFQMLGTRTELPISTITTTTNSHHDLFTLGNNRTARINDDNSSSNTDIDSEFQSEMRTVIQALFGELQQTSPTTITISVSEQENNTDEEIELYTIGRS